MSQGSHDELESALEPLACLCELEKARCPSRMAGISVSVEKRGGGGLGGRKKEEILSELYLQLLLGTDGIPQALQSYYTVPRAPPRPSPRMEH